MRIKTSPIELERWLGVPEEGSRFEFKEKRNKADLQLPKPYSDRVDALLDAGVVERIGRGRGARVVLARSLYDANGEPGVYTRKKGLDHETNKELLVKHLREAGKKGSPMAQLHQVLPQLTRPRVLGLLKELQSEGRAALMGARRGARWLALMKE